MGEKTFSIEVDEIDGTGVRVVHVTGALTPWSRHRLRERVERCLVDGRAAVVLDLAAAELIHPTAAEALLALHQEAAAAGLPLVFCVPPGAVADRLVDMNATFRVFADALTAKDAVRQGKVAARWLFRRLPAEIAAACDVAVLAADACTAWNVPQLGSAARMLAAELFGAVLRHRCDHVDFVVTLRPRALLVGTRPAFTSTARQHRAGDPDGIWDIVPLS